MHRGLLLTEEGQRLFPPASDAYVNSQEWQLAAIREGVAAADRGDLITHEAITDWVDSWDSHEERPPPEAE